MSRLRWLAVLVGIIATLTTIPSISAQTTLGATDTQAVPQQGFQPVVRMLGIQSEDTVEWVVTVSNTGDVIGESVVLRNDLVNALQVETVQINTGTASIDGQTVTITLPQLAPQQSVRFSIITKPLADALITNTICATANNYIGEQCALSVPIQALPATGEPLLWRTRLQWVSLITVSVSLLMIGLGLLGWQFIHE